jgi:hypothetical protein
MMQRGGQMKSTIITFLFAVIVSIAPSLILYTWEAYARSRSNITYEIQSMLSLRGVYTGKPNGLCDEQTIQAIEQYRTRFKIPDGVECSTQFLESLKNDISATLAAATSTANSTVAKTPETISDTATINARLEALETNYKNTNSTVKNISDSLSSYFVTQFDNLASIGVSAFVTAISIIIAFTALIGNFFIKSAVEKAHEQELAKAQLALKSKITIVRLQAASHIFTTIGSYCENLYLSLKTPDQEYQKELYEAYLDIAVNLTHYGFISSKELGKCIKEEKSEPDEKQTEILETCINNYAYFLAPKTLRESDDAQINKGELGKLLIELNKISAPKMLKYWHVKHTIAWAKVHLDNKLDKFDEFNRVIDELIADYNVPRSWKDAIRKKHALYRRANRAFWPSESTAPSTPSSPQG